MHLLCYPRSWVTTYAEQHKSDNVASMDMNDAMSKNEWPLKSLYIDINDGLKEWPYWTLVSIMSLVWLSSGSHAEFGSFLSSVRILTACIA